MAHAKGGCYRCLRGDHLVDLDVQIEGEGALVLCVSCLTEAAEACGLHFNAAAVNEQHQKFEEERARFNPERVRELEEELAAKDAALTQTQHSNAALQDALTRVGKERRAAK